MKILLFSHLFFPKYRLGTEEIVLSVAREFASVGHKVAVAAGEPDSARSRFSAPLLQQDTYEGVQVFRMVFGTRGLKSFSTHIHCGPRITLIQELVKEFMPDIAHFYHIMHFSAEAIPAVKRMGIPVFFTPTDYWAICPRVTLIHSYDSFFCEGPDEKAENCLRCYLKFMPVVRIYEGLSRLFRTVWPLSEMAILQARKKEMVLRINKADGIFPATSTLTSILAQNGVSREKLKTILYGVNVSVSEPLTRAHPLRLGFVGSITPHKGLHVILEALARPEIPEQSVILEIYGALRNDAYAKKIRTLAAKIPRQDIRFMGTFPNEKFGSILARFHALVIPSIWREDAPLVLCSALAAQVPVIASNVPGMAEIIRDGKDGILFKRADSSSLAGAIKQFVDNPNLYAQLRESVNPFVKNTKTYAGEIEAAYRAFLNKQNRNL